MPGVAAGGEGVVFSALLKVYETCAKTECLMFLLNYVVFVDTKAKKN
jgi:hypothetical protein